MLPQDELQEAVEDKAGGSLPRVHPAAEKEHLAGEGVERTRDASWETLRSKSFATLFVAVPPNLTL